MAQPIAHLKKTHLDCSDPSIMAYRTNSHRTAKRPAPNRRAATILRRRSEVVTFTGTRDELLDYILSRWPYSWPTELHHLPPCHDPRIIKIRRLWLTRVMHELAQQWPDVKAALQSAGFLSPTMN